MALKDSGFVKRIPEQRRNSNISLVGAQMWVINGFRGSKLSPFRSSKSQDLYMLEKTPVTGYLLKRQSLEKPANYEYFLHLIKSDNIPSLSLF